MNIEIQFRNILHVAALNARIIMSGPYDHVRYSRLLVQ